MYVFRYVFMRFVLSCFMYVVRSLVLYVVMYMCMRRVLVPN